MDAFCLKYKWPPAKLPSHCVCGSAFSLEHALSCKVGGFITLRHNEVHDFMANLLTETCHYVLVEPPLQPITGKTFQLCSVNQEDCARLDVAMSGFWNAKQRDFLDVRVFRLF